MKQPISVGVLVALCIACVLLSASFSADIAQSQTPRPATRIKPATPSRHVLLDPTPLLQTADTKLSPRIKTLPSIEPGRRIQSTPAINAPPNAAVVGPEARSGSDQEPNSQTVREVTFRVTFNYRYKAQIEFYSQDRNVAWPGNNQSYNINDYNNHVYKLKCNSGEKICYGAWSLGGSKSWGVGMNNRFTCANCCVTCDGSSVAYVLQ